MTKIYDEDYFIRKFSAIPEEKWFVGEYVDPYGDKFCALGHCGERRHESSILVGSILSTEESEELKNLFDTNNLHVTFVNDGLGYFITKRFPQSTPKQRILAALRYIKSKQQSVEISDPPVTAEQVIEELEYVKTVEV